MLQLFLSMYDKASLNSFSICIMMIWRISRSSKIIEDFHSLFNLKSFILLQQREMILSYTGRLFIIYESENCITR